MEQKEQHKRDLLRRWIKGDITAKEESKLRQSAQDDPFLRDAFAGYQRQAEEDHAASLARLRRKTATQSGARVRMLAVWRVAAAVLLLLAAAWWLIPASGLEADETSLVAQQEMRKADTSGDRSDDSTVEVGEQVEEEFIAATEPAETFSADPPAASAGSTTRATENPALTQIAIPEPVAIPPRDESRYGNAFALEDDTIGSALADATSTGGVMEEAEADVVLAEDMTVTEAEEEPIASSPPPPPPTVSSPSYPAQNQGYPGRIQNRISPTNMGPPAVREGFQIIEGKVLDSEGYPIIGATLVEQGTANGTVTDFDGFYRIAVAEKDASLVVTYIGYETQLVAVTDSELDIVITENTIALDEVVVSGYGEKRRQERANSAGAVEPIDGFRALKRYINDQTPINTPRSRIRLQFVVRTDGSLTDFEVLNSTNTAMNSFAIELLQNGPKWQVVEGQAPVTTVYVVNLRG